MNWSAKAQQRVDEFLGAVELQLAHKPAGVRKDVIEGLRNQISEMVSLQGGDKSEVELETVERVLAAMDAPETFGDELSEVEASAKAGATKPARRWGEHWFLLGVAFLMLNAYGVWKLNHSCVERGQVEGALEEGSATVQFQPERVLRLRSVEQVDVSAAREVTLKVSFSDAPDRDQFTRFFRLTTPDSVEVKYHLLGGMHNIIMLETEPVLSDVLVFALDAGLPSAGDSLPENTARRGRIPMEMNLVLREIEAETPEFETPELVATFSVRPQSGNHIKEFVRVVPATDYTIETEENGWRNGLSLRGAFTPGGIYEVTFLAGLPASKNGSSLATSITRTVQFPLPSPAIRVDTSGIYLSPQGSLRIPVLAESMEKYVAKLSQVFANNVVELARRESSADNEYFFWGQKSANLVGASGVVTNVLKLEKGGVRGRDELDLRTMASGELRGAYWLEVGGDKTRKSDGRLLVVTDLGIAVRMFEGGACVWVNSLRTAMASEGVMVTLVAKNNQVLARGVTDSDGIASLSWTTERQEIPFVVIAERDGDLSFLDFNRSTVQQGEGLGGGVYLASGKLEAAVFSERGVYRPGEKVFMQAIVRTKQKKAPEPFPVVWRIRRPDGRVFRDVPVVLDSAGAATAEVELPDYLPTGRYSLELAMPGTFTVLGETKVALEDFVPPQIRVVVQSPKERAGSSDIVKFGVRAEHLFGRPAEGLKAKSEITIKAVPFAPVQWPNWVFGDDENSFAPIYIHLDEQELNASGETEFSVVSRSAWRAPAALQVVQETTVTELGGRAVTAHGAGFLDTVPFYVGIKSDWEGVIRVGVTQRVSVVEVLPNGSPVEREKPLVLTLSRVSWNSALRRNREGRYEWKSERQVVEVHKDTMSVGGTAKSWSFVVNSAGDYSLSASDPASGASTRIEFSAGAVDSQWVAWSREKPGRVELKLDKEKYRWGDVARLQVRSPFAGPALLTVESDRIREVRRVVLDKNTAEFEVAVLADYAPNVYCTLTMIRPAVAESVWSAHRAVGAISLAVEAPETRLKIWLDAPAVVRPKEMLTAQVTVLNDAGNPAPGFVTVMAVDEGICQLTGFETPDPEKYFSSQRALGVSLLDLYSDLVPVVDEQTVNVPVAGGDSALAVLKRRLNPIKANRFKPVALWQAALPLDADGKATAQLELPEFNGELRLMAVAYNEEQTGSTSQPVRVKRDLVVQPAFPRFLAMGDRCEASAILYNEGKTLLSAKVRVTCGGPLRAEKAEQMIQIAAGGRAQVSIPLEAGPGPGLAICTVEVEAGAESFRDSIELAVRPASASQVFGQNSVLQGGESMTLKAPAEWLKESVSMSGTLSSMPSVQLGRALDYVENYPYGCLEQTVSGAFPLLVVGNWAQRLSPRQKALGDTEAIVRAAIRRVWSMQRGSGGFAMWPSSNSVDEDASLYAIHFLVEAQAAGIEVSSDFLESALGWLRKELERTISSSAKPEEWVFQMQKRAYVCHILALAGRPNAGWNARLREQSARLNYAAKAHLALAFLFSGEPRQAVALMETMKLPITRSRASGRLLDSDVRDAALLLCAWAEVELQGEASASLTQFLNSRQQDGHWGNTHDDAMALMGIGKIAKHLPDTPRAFSGQIKMPSGEVRTFSGTNDVNWSLDLGAGGPVEVINNGKAPLYFGARLEGVSTRAESSSDSHISIQRETFDAITGAPLDVSTISQGKGFVVRLSVDTKGSKLDNLVIEDLLPACWEIENPNLAASQKMDWLPKSRDGSQITNEGELSREMRDDRLLIFTGAVQGKAQYHYAVRAVTPGTFKLPPPSVVSMYDADTRGVGEAGAVRVLP